MLSRRAFLFQSGLTASVVAGSPRLLYAASPQLRSLAASMATMEMTNGGRIGVAVLDTSTGERAGYRADDRFPFCSTFKFLLASAVLQRVDQGSEQLNRQIPVPSKPLLGNSPLTEPHASGTMDVRSLCQAALTRSDNTAANLLLETLGGPEGLTSFARSIGDSVTRLDRWETSLNESLPGDLRDTTSPTAMANNLNRILLGSVLQAGSRDLLTGWMELNATGLERLRKDLPLGWRAADKTGSNGDHTSNDIAVLWPVSRSPIILTAYITLCPGPESKRAEMLATIGRLVHGHPA
ncbi:MAG: class A beta-lactamase [Janthinobacterium lividum]